MKWLKLYYAINNKQNKSSLLNDLNRYSGVYGTTKVAKIRYD